MESCGEMEIAKNFYETSKDNLSLARIYCYTDQVDKVISVCVVCVLSSDHLPGTHCHTTSGTSL